MENNKNTIIAIVLMLVVWLGFSFLFPQKPVEPKPAAVAAKAETAAGQSAAEPSQPAPAPAVAAAPVVAPPVANQDAAGPEQEIVVDTPLVRAVFTTLGAKLKSFTLKDFQQTTQPDSPLVQLLPTVSSQDGSLRTDGTESFGIAPDAAYQTSAPPELDVAAGKSAQLTFQARSPSGAVIQKIFVFQGDRYDFQLQVKVVNSSDVPLRGNLNLTLVHPWDPEHSGDRFNFIGPVTLAGDKVQTTKVDDLAKKPLEYGSDTVWSGFENKYFMAVGVPLKGAVSKVQVEKTAAGIENRLETPYLTLDQGQSRTFDFLLYFGPRDLRILKSVDHQLAKAIDFGFFSILAVPLLHVLQFFYTYVGNYGVAIILITIIIKLLFWPLTQKSYTSMKSMQKLQPEMQKIRTKYKNDKERLNREMMELYKTHRVNPLGGCLPMLVQIPVFFALYRVLLDSIELRHAPFAFWLTDLSAKDPYYITPLIMGATMFLQQKMSPSTMDPTQAKIFMLMPVVFTFLFLNFPSGLVIYWLVNNLLTIAQQYLINRKPA